MEKRKNITSKIKAEIVLSLLRGEDAELLSREHGVTIADISQWRDQFVKAAQLGLSVSPPIQCSVLPNVRLDSFRWSLN